MTGHAQPAVDIEDIRQLFAGVLEVTASEVTDDADFAEELDVNSLTMLEIADRLDERYGIELPIGEFMALSSLSEVRDLVDRLLRARTADIQPETRGWKIL
ncbi:acyl carrier protein [Nocardia sp. NPDC049190]|uniref:acyl carrier protein n=1 Tax=Nocardia sp. NPDC049190 TaxID=3155650 RepID=UPI00340F0207